MHDNNMGKMSTLLIPCLIEKVQVRRKSNVLDSKLTFAQDTVSNTRIDSIL